MMGREYGGTRQAALTISPITTTRLIDLALGDFDRPFLFQDWSSGEIMFAGHTVAGRLSTHLSPACVSAPLTWLFRPPAWCGLFFPLGQRDIPLILYRKSTI